jgi:predicted DNA-binding transcriptional regulator AlpA
MPERIKDKNVDLIDVRSRITASINDFTRMSGISRAYVYRLLDKGELRSIHIGVRHLILVDSYLDFIQRLQMDG